MDGWKKERVGTGRYHVRGADGYRMAGLVIGGGARWAVELDGRTIGHYATAAAGCAALVRWHARTSIDAETMAREWLPADDDWAPRGPAVPRPFSGA